jgi:hypothetical protein
MEAAKGLEMTVQSMLETLANLHGAADPELFVADVLDQFIVCEKQSALWSKSVDPRVEKVARRLVKPGHDPDAPVVVNPQYASDFGLCTATAFVPYTQPLWTTFIFAAEIALEAADGIDPPEPAPAPEKPPTAPFAPNDQWRVARGLA